MLVIRYSKTDCAEFISHLDTMRHLQKTIVRGKIPMEYSKGFNPHMLLFMSAPLGVGIKSLAEYCVVETTMDAKDFKNRFNQYAPFGFKCMCAVQVSKRPNIQADMNSAEYLIEGINKFDVHKVLDQQEFLVTDKRGDLKEVRNKILDLKFVDNGLIALLSFGNNTLRPDVLGEALVKLFGGNITNITKTNAFINGVCVEEAVL